MYACFYDTIPVVTIYVYFLNIHIYYFKKHIFKDCLLFIFSFFLSDLKWHPYDMDEKNIYTKKSFIANCLLLSTIPFIKKYEYLQFQKCIF